VLAMEDNHRGYLCYDLLTGRVTPTHPLFPWLVRHGALPDDLVRISTRKIPLDVIGMNFYPQWSTRQLYVTERGKIAYRAIEHEGSSFATLIRDYYERYRVPIIVTETSAFGAEEARSNWLQRSVRDIKDLRASGVPVVGYTWFPMFTMIDWRYRFGRLPASNYRIELGLYQLQDGPATDRWAASPLVAEFCKYVKDPSAAIGEFRPPDAASAPDEASDARLIGNA
jgi:hypothetical protein